MLLAPLRPGGFVCSMHFLGQKRPYDTTGLYDPTFTTAVCQSDDRLRCAGTLSERGCSTARHYAPVDDHALPVGRFLDGDQSEALREPDGGTRLGLTDVGALSDPCYRE